MPIRGRCGFVSNEEMSSLGSINEVTPGKCLSKKAGNFDESASKLANSAPDKKRVQTKEPSYLLSALPLASKTPIRTSLGMATNINCFPGQM